ncbi:MAG: NAD(P)-dependent oxidoreductase [Christensenellales bacterium]
MESLGEIMQILVYYRMNIKATEMLIREGFDPIEKGEEGDCVHDNWVTLEKMDVETREKINIMIGEPIDFNDKLMKLLPNLKWIHSKNAGLTGCTSINWNLVDKYNVVITPSNIHEVPISEMAVGMLLALSNDLSNYFRRQQLHDYSQITSGKTTISNKTVLVVGTGNIGKKIGYRLKHGFNMRTLGINSDGHYVEDFDDTGDMKMLDIWIKEADALILTCAYTEKTTNLINAHRLKAMKSTAILINLARGAIINQHDLLIALKEKWIRGAALDVFTVEPIPSDDPLWDLQNVIITPHISGQFLEYDLGVVQAFLRNLPYFKSGEFKKMPDYANIKRY